MQAVPQARSVDDAAAGEAADASASQQQQQQLIAVGYRGGPVVLLSAATAAPRCLALSSENPRLAPFDQQRRCPDTAADWRLANGRFELPSEPAADSGNNKDSAKADETTEENAADKDKAEAETEATKKEQQKVPPVMAKQLGDRTTVYGPFPCQPIPLLASYSGGVTAFAGGLAKNTHADVHSVTLTVGSRQACYQLPAAPVGLLLPRPDCLLAVCQTRLLAIDIADSDWRPFRPPYLRCLSAADAPPTVARPPPKAAAAAGAAAFSQRDWPINGGRFYGGEASTEEKETAGEERHLLVTGHADGGVAFWMLDARKGLGVPFGRLDTARLFVADAAAVGNGKASGEAGDAFPKLLRNVGVDFPPPPPVDPRLAIFDVQLVGEGLLVTGSGGQAVVWSPTDELEAGDVQLDLRTVRADFLAEGSATGAAYEWTGPEALQIRPPEAVAKFGAPFRPSCVALPVTSAAYSQRWGILAVGTARTVSPYSTLAPSDRSPHTPTLPAVGVGASGDADSGAAAVNGGASGSDAGSGLGSSLRQSFRMLKKFRPGRKQEYTGKKKPEEKPEDKPEDKREDKPEDKPEDKRKTKPKTEEKAGRTSEETAKKEDESAAEGVTAAAAEAAAPPPPPEKQKLGPPRPPAPRPDRRPAAHRDTVDAANARAVSLLAGDASGRILAFQLTRPPKPAVKDEAATAAADATNDEAAEQKPEQQQQQQQPEEGEWQAQLVKELHLKHGAPVAALYTLSARNHSIVDAESTVDGPHELLVASEEQVKLFNLPGLKPRVKCRLTGRLLSSGHAVFPSSTRPDVREFGLAAYLDNGTLLVLGFPGLKVHAWREQFLRSGDVAICCRLGAPVALTLEAGGRLASVHRLSAGSLGAAFQRSAGLDLPEDARKKPEEQPAQQQPAAATAAAAEAAPVAEAPAANGTGEEKDGGEEAKAAAKEEDKSGRRGLETGGCGYHDGRHQGVRYWSEVAGEDKRESTVSGGENADNKPAVAEVTPAAEIKCGSEVAATESAATGNAIGEDAIGLALIEMLRHRSLCGTRFFVENLDTGSCRRRIVRAAPPLTKRSRGGRLKKAPMPA
uniref:LLGL domain-containing protein n=1 Tax=Macrostomum lignano TaxID=282301 RepID=A0A1I8ISR8_9PLAT